MLKHLSSPAERRYDIDMIFKMLIPHTSLSPSHAHPSRSFPDLSVQARMRSLCVLYEYTSSRFILVFRNKKKMAHASRILSRTQFLDVILPHRRFMARIRTGRNTVNVVRTRVRFPHILCRLSSLWSAERRYQCLFNSSSSLPSVNVTPPNSSPPRFGNKRKMKSASRTDSRTQSLDVIFPRRRIVPRVRLIATPFPVHTSFSPDSRQVGMNHE